VSAIDDFCNQNTGSMFTAMHGIADSVEMALRSMKAHNHILVGTPAADGTVSVADTLTDISFSYNGVDYPAPQGAVASVSAKALGLQIQLPGHTYNQNVKLGTLMLDLVDNVFLAQLTGVNSIGELLNQLIPCDRIADWVWSLIGNVCFTDTTC